MQNLSTGNTVNSQPLPDFTSPDIPNKPIIVSGFESYRSRDINSSTVIGRAIARAYPQDVGFVEMPVVWGSPMDILARQPNGPAIWIALGEASKRFRVETIAYNHRVAHVDKRGELPTQTTILHGHPAMVNPAPAAEFAEKLTQSGFPTTVSNDAGGYLCEELFYALLYHQAHVWNTQTLIHFIHVPVFGATYAPHGEPGEIVDKAMLTRFAHALRSALGDWRTPWLLA